MGLFPMHTVTIDAHTVAPPPISALISTALMNVGFIAIFRMYSQLAANKNILPWMNNILIISGISSLIVATGYMLKASLINVCCLFFSRKIWEFSIAVEWVV
jgi:hydrogenase-4 component F